MWIEPDDPALRDLLRGTNTVAVGGVSPDPLRPSNEVYHYLMSASDYELYPVNPMIDQLDGSPVYPDLAALPVVPDMVDVFRRADQLQQGWWDEHLALDAEAAGMLVVMDRCLKVEHARLL